MNWPVLALGEILNDAQVFVDGDWVESKDQDPNGEVRLIQLADVGEGYFIDKSARFLTASKANQLKCTYLTEGDVLVARMPDPLGRACIFPRIDQQCVTVVDVCIIRPNPKRVDSRYLTHCLNSEEVRLQILKQATGTTRQRISRGNLKTIRIPLLPLVEQRRIASLLDKAEELRTKRRAAINLLDQLPQAIFFEKFGNPTTNPMNWSNSRTLGSVADIVSGITKGRKINGKTTREIPYMAVVNVQDKSLNLETIKTIEATEEEITRYELKLGDLLLTEGGDPDKLGRGTIWNAELPKAIHQNHVFRVRLTSKDIAPVYLSWLVGSTYGKAYFLRQAKQTTGIATINMGQLKRFPLLLPPVDLQNQFVHLVETINSAKATHRTALAKLDTLLASLQAKTFGGS